VNRAVRGYISGMIKFSDVFSTYLAFVLFSQVMQQQTLSELEI